ncbi:MAG: copper chaperone PCu(A)C [Gammaproteobacteria bacterium]|uniref:Copper chaperone PCu(A)C n=1 Tax=Candidatus Thiopontia autotrophica TaxID=2841688 RepID=A0A8J6P398_9GAMM|nr:copper chaperone PCu(A)C [Candidatus Thiopontia autotrophica]MBL6969212.1 copper chaperone PCu(A)C [Gammaproteobacteria bacterium]
MKIRFLRAVAALFLFGSFSAVFADGVMVSDPWVRAAPPNAPALAAFMTLENHGGADVALVEVRGPAELGRVEMHRTSMADGMMKMVQQQNIPVAAHSSTVLKPGSWHIMMIGPKKVPSAGEQVRLTLVFSDGSEQMVMAGVRRGGMMMKDGGHQMMRH